MGPLGNLLARSPENGELRWHPTARRRRRARTVVEDAGAGHVAAAPAAVQDEILAWVVARFEASPGQVETSALEYGALLVALELLRERTALEVEHRLRGGFLDELFSGEFVEDLIIKQGAAFGLDLTAPTRIYLVEPAEGELGPANATCSTRSARDCAAVSGPARSGGGRGQRRRGAARGVRGRR